MRETIEADVFHRLALCSITTGARCTASRGTAGKRALPGAGRARWSVLAR